MNNISRIKKIIPITDKVSPTFCLAKWYHSNIYLQLGLTHSCYHPRPHNIPLDTTVPSSLHNTPQKKNERAAMMEGSKPDGCQYCWNIEDLGADHISERMERNSSILRDGLIEAVVKDPMGNFNPEYIEISFGNECNFKCGYCHPKYSTAYYKEIKDFGPYLTVKNHRNDIDYFTIYEEETNPYVKLWWEWWPEVSQTLNVLRITGGEPLLQQSTWRLFDELEKNPLPNLELNINSNLGVKSVLIERLCDKINSLLKSKKIKQFKLFTSIDTWGTPAEYIRTGLNLSVWEKNLDIYLTRTHTAIDCMITFNVLTVTNFTNLLEKILEWRKKYNGWVQSEWQRIRFDVAYLVQPLQYDINILPKEEFMPYMYQSLDYMRQHQKVFSRNTFMQLETEKFANIVKYMETTHYSDERLLEGRKDFYNWFTEYDRRRSTDFLTTFPKLKNFYLSCRELNV